MAILTAAVVLVGILCVIDLLLSFGIIRRLREQNEALQLVQQQQTAGLDDDIALPAGSAVGAFAATTVGGTELTNVDIIGSPLLIGFFSPNCEPCKERMPQFIEYATRFNGRVIAVASGSVEETTDMVARLGEVGDVLVEPNEEAPVHKAFGAKGYPAMCLVGDDGVVQASGWEMAALPVPAAL
ncbi:thiol-disulfide isomerase/thioredoxin [Kibdelosporangium banguiense]|uniref:Thiol-disulfide isomerase/thioredoxin n=1 Tax=Kibdelosporangium banguiense TaxID=1365924 RepID=A0ABS4TKU4_9PSEU|nr:TlpA disulfide reductase family protein [Kibdelosporangium banguiense]MBP2325032.1 thiol-disulfide isomerase/thioredoxin [Kibdelosporangium banguiense]